MTPDRFSIDVEKKTNGYLIHIVESYPTKQYPTSRNEYVFSTEADAKSFIRGQLELLLPEPQTLGRKE